MIGFTFYLYSQETLKPYELFRFSNGFLYTKKIISKGLQIGIGATVEYLTQLLMTFYCGLSGETQLLGMQAAASYSLLINFPISALTEAGSVKAANCCERKSVAYKLFANVTIFFSTMHATVCCLMFHVFRKNISGLFINQSNYSEEKFLIISKFMSVQSVIELLNSIKNSTSSILAAANETGFSFSVSIAFIFLLNSVLATLSQFTFKESALHSYSLQLFGFSLSAMALGMAWYQKDKIPTGSFSNRFQKISGYCNAFWSEKVLEKPQVMMRESREMRIYQNYVPNSVIA